MTAHTHYYNKHVARPTYSHVNELIGLYTYSDSSVNKKIYLILLIWDSSSKWRNEFSYSFVRTPERAYQNGKVKTLKWQFPAIYRF